MVTKKGRKLGLICFLWMVSQCLVASPVSASYLTDENGNYTGGYQELQGGPGINVVYPGNPSNVEVPGEYATIFGVNENIRYTVTGATPHPTATGYADEVRVVEKNSGKRGTSTTKDPEGEKEENRTYAYFFGEYGATLGQEQSILIENAGVFKGRSLDLKLVIDGFDYDREAREQVQEEDKKEYFFPVEMGVYVYALSYWDFVNNDNSIYGTTMLMKDAFLLLGSVYPGYLGLSFPELPTITFLTNNAVHYHYEIYYSGTDQKEEVADFKGLLNFFNLNGQKSMQTEITSENSSGLLSSLYMKDQSESEIILPNRPVDWKLLYRESDVFGIARKGLEFTADTYKYSKPENENIDRGRLMQKITGSRQHFTLTQKVKDQNSTGAGVMMVSYSNKSISRVAPATPVIVSKVNDTTYLDPETQQRSSNYGKLMYSFQQTIPQNDKENRDTSLVWETQVPTTYKIDQESITVKEYGSSTYMDLKEIFDVEFKNSVGAAEADILVLTAKADKITGDDFVGKIYEIGVSASRQKDAKFDTKLDDYIGSTDKIGNGYLNYQLLGINTVSQLNSAAATTKLTYTYHDSKKTLTANPNMQSSLEQTTAKILYQGIPDADQADGLTVPQGGDIKAYYKNPKDLVKNLRLDTGDRNVGDYISVSYKNSAPSIIQTKDGQKVELILTTEDGLSNSLTVEIPSSTVKNTVVFIDEGNQAIHDSVVLKDLALNDLLNLQENKEVQTIVKDLTDKGYTPLSFEEANDKQTETAYRITNAEGTITYKFEGTLTLDVPEEMIFSNGIVRPAMNQSLKYSGEDAFAISVKDLRSTKNNRGKFTLSANLLKSFTSEEEEVLTGVKLFHNTTWIPEKKDGDASIYTESGSDPEKTLFNIVLDAKNGEAEKGLRLELAKHNNAESKGYQATIQWTLVNGP